MASGLVEDGRFSMRQLPVGWGKVFGAGFGGEEPIFEAKRWLLLGVSV